MERQLNQTTPLGLRRNFYTSLYTASWEAMELKQRLRHSALVLGQHLPQDYRASIEILKNAAGNFSGLGGMIFSEWVECYGLNHPHESLEALSFFTQVGSAEFAIRPFILKYEEETMRKMLEWSQHDNVHVRRLSSEGARPRLPWACALPKFKNDPSLVLPILENLKNDPELYVRKSVANCLNDIAKDHPTLVVSLLKKWAKDDQNHTNWIIKHALRSLVKIG